MPIELINSGYLGGFSVFNRDNQGSISVLITSKSVDVPSATPSTSVTPSVSLTPTVTVTPSISSTPSVTLTPSISATPSVTPTITPSVSPSPNPIEGDAIRSAISPSFTASYDAATIGSFVVVDSASYLAVSSSVSAVTFGMDQSTMNGPNGPGTTWGAPFAFNFYQDGVIPSGSYIVAFSTVFANTGMQTASVYYGTGSIASGSSGTIIGSPFSVNVASVPLSGSRQYFVRKAPIDPLPANSWTYMWSRFGIRIKGPLVNPVQYKNVGNDPPNPTLASGFYSNWTTAGAPSHQFLFTGNKQW